MIDWAALKWDADELRGISKIEVVPNALTDDHVIINTRWFDAHGTVVRTDVHVELLKPLDLSGNAGAL